MPTRLVDHPIITPQLDPSIGGNINGPSLVRVPPWLPSPLGRYYLYFAHHQGKSIRLAYADDLRGPWRIHAPGTLQLSQTRFPAHIASPDVHLDHDRRRVLMYYHGCCVDEPGLPNQVTCLATSEDGLQFTSGTTALCGSYLRRFTWRGVDYGLVMPGRIYRFTAEDTPPEPGPNLADDFCFPTRFGGEGRKARHFAVRVVGDVLRVYFSRTGDAPEHLLRSDVALSDDWMTWRATPPVSVLRPERAWEGGDLPATPSRGGAIHEPACQLRDPAVFGEHGRVYLVYSVAGESGLGIAEVEG